MAPDWLQSENSFFDMGSALTCPIILPEGKEKVFRAEATHSDLLLAKKPVAITTRKCLIKISSDIARWLVEKGIVSPSEVHPVK